MSNPLLRRGPSGQQIIPNEAIPPNSFLGPDGLWHQVDVVGDFPLLYVDQATGSDTNDGSQSAPFATLDRALALAAVSETKTTIMLAAGDYDSILLQRNMFPIGFVIRGTESTQVAGPVTLASVTNDNYTFSPSPTWTIDEWIGYTLEFLSGPSNFNVGKGRTIIGNGAATAQLVAEHFDGNLTGPVAGDVFQVAEPAARINVTPPPPVSGFNAQDVVRQVFGGRSWGQRGSYTFQEGAAEFYNVLFYDDYATDTALSFVGSFWLYGCQVVKTTNSALIVQLNAGESFIGADWNGDYASAVPVSDQGGMYGNGLGLRNTGGGSVPSLEVQQSNVRALVTCSEIHCDQSDLEFIGGDVDRARAAGYPHGCIDARNGSHILVRGPHINIDCPIGEWDFNAEFGSGIEVGATGDVVHQGVGGCSRARFNSTISLFNVFTVTGSGMGIRSEYASCIRINSWDGADLGDAVAGASPSLSRSAAPWAAGESILEQANDASATTLRDTLPGDGATIFRN